MQADIQLTRPVLKKIEQVFSADAAESVTGRGLCDAAIDDIDIIPMGKTVADRAGALRVIGLEVFHRLVREDHAPAECIARPVALEDIDLAIGVAQFHRDGEIETGGTSAEAGDFQMLAHWAGSVVRDGMNCDREAPLPASSTRSGAGCHQRLPCRSANWPIRTTTWSSPTSSA